MTARRLFFYGSLRDPELLATVLGRAAGEVALAPATLPDHEARKVEGEGFPCAAPRPGAALPGALIDGVSRTELDRVAFFEDDEEFELRDVTVTTEAGAVEALSFFPRPIHRVGGPWSFEAWAASRERALLLECARELMPLHEQGADWSDERLWPGIKIRALARLRARRETRGERHGLDAPAGATRTVEVSRPYASLFAVEEHVVRHPTFEGGETPELRRAAFASGDAVTVLPWDPARDSVLLVTQWRAGPHARGAPTPWPVEVIAGRIDRDEPPEAAARREAREEAGLTLGPMEAAAAYYASPGVLAEHVTSYVAAADLSRAGGVHGLDDEEEHIRSRVLSFEQAMDLVARREADTSPALISLLWLAWRRERLRAAWAEALARARAGA